MAPIRPLTFGVSRAHGGGPAQVSTWAPPLLEALAGLLGVPVELVVAADYEHQLAAVQAGGLDLAWLPPLLHAEAAAGGARLLAVPERSGWITCRAAILVSEGAPWRFAHDVRSARAAWSSRLSATGHVFPRIDLVAHGGSLASEAYFETPAGALFAVSSGQADLCACMVPSAAAAPDAALAEVRRAHGERAAGLRILHVTDLIPPDGIVLSAGAPVDEEAARAALLELHRAPGAQRALRELLQAERLVPATGSLRQMLRSWTELALRRAEA